MAAVIPHFRHGADRSMAARHPAPPDDVDENVAFVRAFVPLPRALPEWDGQWTQRPPSTLAEEVAAAQEAHERWVAGFPDQALPADADVDVVPYIQPGEA